MNIRALVIAGLLWAGTSLNAYSQTYTLAKSVIGSGMTPVGNLGSGAFSLDGTIGQPVINTVSGNPFIIEQGFWYGVPASSSDVKEGPADVAGFALDQNYPNPFNPSTTIKYSIPERTKVTIRVMNLLGQEVHAPLVDDIRDAGTWQIDFTDADNLPSGTYIYRMDAGSFSASKRMVLLK